MEKQAWRMKKLTARTQSEIQSSWQGSTDPVVSVVCATYNQDQYLASALDGFFAQRTSFPFEVIVHDDASTDETAAIIRSYQARYPDILKPVTQTQNQYSKGGFKPWLFTAGKSSSEYVAVCEGDDYWIAEDKLQRQVDALEQNKEADFSFHAALELIDGKLQEEGSWDYGKDQILYLDTLMAGRAGSFAPTASYLFRRQALERLPSWIVSEAPVADFFVERYAALRGGACYLSEPLSVYRNMASGSWTARMHEKEAEHRAYIDAMLRCMDLMAPDFPRFAKELGQLRARFSLKYALEALLQGDDARFKSLIEKSVQGYRYDSRKQRISHYLSFWPGLLRPLVSARRRP